MISSGVCAVICSGPQERGLALNLLYGCTVPDHHVYCTSTVRFHSAPLMFPKSQEPDTLQYSTVVWKSLCNGDVRGIGTASEVL